MHEVLIEFFSYCWLNGLNCTVLLRTMKQIYYIIIIIIIISWSNSVPHSNRIVTFDWLWTKALQVWIKAKYYSNVFFTSKSCKLFSIYLIKRIWQERFVVYQQSYRKYQICFKQGVEQGLRWHGGVVSVLQVQIYRLNPVQAWHK